MLKQMQVEMYNPVGLYGFAGDSANTRVFFHLNSFVKGQWPGLDSSPPPITGELVAVEYGPSTESKSGMAPKAILVTRLSAPELVKAIVVKFYPERGWGFARSSHGVEYYVHRSDTLDNRIMLEGQELIFYAGTRRGKPRGCHIEIGQMIR